MALNKFALCGHVVGIRLTASLAVLFAYVLYLFIISCLVTMLLKGYNGKNRIKDLCSLDQIA